MHFIGPDPSQKEARMTDQENTLVKLSGTLLPGYLGTRRIDPQWAKQLRQEVDLSRFKTPLAARLVGTYRLEGVRNAWHSTSIGYHHGIEFDLQRLQKLAKDYRAPGTTLWIENRDALWLKFENANLLIVRINYGRYLTPVRHAIPHATRESIIDFMEYLDYLSFNWFAYYELLDWRPDLAPTRKKEKYRAISYGGRYRLGWSHPKPCNDCWEFRLFAKEFVEQCIGPDEVENLDEFIRDEH